MTKSAGWIKKGRKKSGEREWEGNFRFFIEQLTSSSSTSLCFA
jgi:hypothetical protein